MRACLWGMMSCNDEYMEHRETNINSNDGINSHHNICNIGALPLTALLIFFYKVNSISLSLINEKGRS